MDANDEEKEKIARLERLLIQSKKREALGKIVGAIAHDFGNILTGIICNLYVAKTATSDTKAIARVESAEELTRQAMEITEQLLVLAREDATEVELLSLTELMQKALKLANVSISKHIKRTNNICSDQLLIKGNRAQIQQLVRGLIENASDALPGTSDPEITFSLSPFSAGRDFREKHPAIKGKRFARLSISDNGCGMPKSIQDKIFEPFFTTKGEDEGVGLGLSMVHEIIQSHGGVIEFVSDLGKGTSFHMFLPLADRGSDSG